MNGDRIWFLETSLVGLLQLHADPKIVGTCRDDLMAAYRGLDMTEEEADRELRLMLEDKGLTFGSALSPERPGSEASPGRESEARSP